MRVYLFRGFFAAIIRRQVSLAGNQSRGLGIGRQSVDSSNDHRLMDIGVILHAILVLPHFV